MNVPRREFDLVRLRDTLLAGTALIALLPVGIAIAVAIKLDSRGPIFFGQWRIGRGGKPFRLWKFRSMIVDAERRGGRLTASGDDRVTRVGRWLRRWKLDELPQLWNVVRGEMALVGPRPEVPEWVEHWPERWKPLLLSVRPGLTDIVSLELRDEERLLALAADPAVYYRDVLLYRKARRCAAYLRRRTPARDWGVLGRTFLALLRLDRRTRTTLGRLAPSVRRTD